MHTKTRSKTEAPTVLSCNDQQALLSSDNEYMGMSAANIVNVASQMLDELSTDSERAFAMAIVLRDRLKNADEIDITGAILSEMLIELLEGDPVPHIKQCLSALLEKCKTVGGES